jgi:hypothetical protein
MSSQKIIRISHFLLILGGIYTLVAPLLFRAKSNIGVVILIIGWIGVHLRQFQKVGRLGHLGFSIFLLSFILPIFLKFQPVNPLSTPNFLIIFIIQYIGIAIYGVAILRAKVLPKIVGYLLLIALPVVIISGIGINFFSIIVGFILLAKPNLNQASSLIPLTQRSG